MGESREQFNKESIGNLRFEFFTNVGSLTVEAWHCTRRCSVTTFSKGVRRRTEVRLSDESWWKLIVPVSYCGFWKWEKRYDSHATHGYAPSWSFSTNTDDGWYFSSGDGSYPEGLLELLKELTVFASAIEGRETERSRCFLSPFIETGKT